MRSLVLAALAAEDVMSENRPGDADHLAETVEARYQALKAELLGLVALGRLPAGRMEAMLLHIQRMRRGAQIARKARRRLSPWLDRQRRADAGETTLPRPEAGEPDA